MLLSPRAKIEAVRQAERSLAMVNEMIMLDAANSIERLMESGLSLRGIARKIDRSPSYISLIRNRKAEASMATYKLLLTLEMERK